MRDKAVWTHIRHKLTDPRYARDWDHLFRQMGDPCRGCPADQSRPDAPLEPPPCYECPFWALRLDLARLELLRRLEGGGSASGRSDKA